MQTSWKAACYAAIAATILVWFHTSALGAPQPFVISIRTVHGTFKPGAEIMVGVSLVNMSDKDVLIGTCAPKADVDGLRIDVADAQGKTAPETEILRWLRGEPVTKPTELMVTTTPPCGAVPPKRFINDGFILNRFYDLSNPGKYTIQVQRMDPDSKVLVKSNIITVTITP